MKSIKLLILLALQMTLVLAETQLRAQSLAYSNAIAALNPAGYWPMHETAAPAPADIETNYGSLGALGTAYYADWWENNGAPGNMEVIHGYPGPLQNVPNGAVYLRDAYTFPDPTNTSWALVPHTSPLTALAPPFTIEAWVYGSNGDFGDIVGIDGTALNGGNNNNGYGFRFSWGGGSVGNIFQSYDEGFAGNPGTTAVTTNAWHYALLVGIITTNGSTLTTNYNIYLDAGLYQGSASSGFKPDNWDPLLIGGGMWNNTGSVRNRDMGLANVAIYTNALSTNQMAAHYYAATNASAGPNDYYNAVISNNPLLFYHMDSPAFLGWTPTNTWPALHNYGSAAVNGFYAPGVTPGAATGPPFAGDLPLAMPGNGLSAYADAGNNSLYNPTGHTPFSVTACFQGNPADSRLESLVGHGDNSWHLRLDTGGKVHFGTGAQANDVVTPGIYNDGNWHVAVGVYDGATNYLYLDGSLAVSAANAKAINGTNLDVLAGGDPQYLSINNGAGMQFSGNLCDVAYFANALTAAQITSLVNTLGVPIYVISQPVLSRAGSSDVFTVTANGSSPAFQWYYNTVSNYSGAIALTDGGGVSGSAKPSVTIANLSDYYFAVATNNYSSVTSSIVQVPQLTALLDGTPFWNTNTAAQTNILVTFSYSLDPVSSTTVANYSLSPGVAIVSAALVAANEVSLTTATPLTPGAPYTLSVQNVDNFFGVVQASNPTNLAVGIYPAAPVLWVIANPNYVSVDATGTNVTGWTDLSSSGNNLSVGSTIPPSLATNAWGDTVVRFVGTNSAGGEFLYNSSLSLGILGDMTIAIVLNMKVSGGEVAGWTGSTHANFSAPYDVNMTSALNESWNRGNGVSIGGCTSTNATDTIGEPHVLIGSELGNTVYFSADGQFGGAIQLGSSYQESSDGVNPLGQLQIGERADNFASTKLSGDISEEIIIPAALTTNDEVAVYKYLFYAHNVVQTNATKLAFSASGGNLTLSWPINRTGWILQSQTNSVSAGISTNWFNVAGSTSANQMVIPVNLTNGNVFYRLVYP